MNKPTMLICFLLAPAIIASPLAGGAVTITYTYDNAGRLTRADYGDSASITYTYDANGNLLLRETTGDGTAISAHIEANGLEGPATIGAGENVSISVALQAGSTAGTNADWWAVAATSTGWYTFDTLSWRPGLFPTYQGALFDLGAFEILDMPLPAGAYTFYFGVDTNMNGSPDMDRISYDQIDVTVR